MEDYLDFFNVYVMGCVQMLTGFYFFSKLLNKKVKIRYYVLFTACWTAVLRFAPSGRIAESGEMILLLTVGGIFICRAAVKLAVLYAALVVEVMHLCYGIMDSLLSILYPLTSSFDQKIVGIAFMVLGNLALLLAALCCHIIYRYFSYYENVRKQYVLMVFIPILLLFFMGEYISSIILGSSAASYGKAVWHTAYVQLFVIQFLGLASLYCIMFAYKKLLQSFRLATELSLLEQQEHFLLQYVEEAKARYEKTKSFRHDIKNHITVLKQLLQGEKSEQALHYITDLEGMAEEMSFPCSTNNPVTDILLGNKLGLAKSRGIDVSCTLVLPYPCLIRDIDLCIIFSHALDNAVCACNHMDNSADRYIHVSGHIQGDFLLLEIENSFRGKGLFREGTGLSNVHAAAEKYHGAVSIKTQGMVFTLSVLLIIPNEQHNMAYAERNR